MLRGHYFFPLSARFVEARALRDGEALNIRGEDDAVLAHVPLKTVRVSERLGRTRRRLEFADGSSFDTDDNDGVDQMLGRRSLLHRLESSWRVVLASVVVAAVAGAAFALYGVPATAGWMARHTPPSVAAYVTRQSLEALDQVALETSKTPAAVQTHYRALLAGLAARAPHGVKGYRLVFRAAPGIGPNAFALPDGSIIVTDQIVPLVKQDAEIEGVLAHEMSHVDRAHGLQRIYQASLVPAAIAFLTGDASQLGQFAAILPGILLQSAYSREFEQQADDDAAALMRKLGKSPAPMADLLERLEKNYCGKKGCGPSWLGSHPATAARAARLRKL